MEGPAEVNEAVESSAEGPNLKRKENDEQPPQQPNSCNALEDPDINWSEQHHSSMRTLEMRSPETFLETLGGKSLINEAGSASEPGVMVEELTLNNYKGTSSFRGEGSSAKKGLWHNFTRLGGNSIQIDHREDMGNSLSPQLSFRRQLASSTQLRPNYSKVSDHLAESENRIASRSTPSRPAGGIRTKVLPASGIPQFVVKNHLSGKGVAFVHQGVHKEPRVVIQSQNNAARSNCDVEVDSKLLGRPSEKMDAKAFVASGGGTQASGVHHDGITLREWLAPRRHSLDKVERLQIFKQIVELVDTSHSQGLALQHFRPSSFLILPLNQIKYVGPFVQMEQSLGSINQDMNYLEHHTKRKRHLEHGKENHGILSPKHLKLDESYKALRMSGRPCVSTLGHQLSTSEFLKLEERWYAGPEDINESACPLSSNIYSLGVLFFELFCYFATWELHAAAMSDLRYRILPPSFLSESPKEAGFCLWLLYPEPSSRPSSGDILLHDLICDGKDLSSLKLSSTSIDDEDAEADLLLHFLLNLNEQKEKQAARLVADVGCLKADIEEVERRCSSRTEFLSSASGTLMSFNEISDKNPHRGSIHVEGTSNFSMPNVNEERLTKNIDQLQNAYFSLRSKIELSETTIAARSDMDVLKIRENISQVQSDADVWKKSTDPLGTFFEGLCKYARYSKFEVCGNIRSVDILNSVNVICSLSFDRDEDYFAAAGVSKKIKVFEFDALLNDSVDIHYPLIEMPSRSRLSCVCWNNYIKNYLASTDYDGVVQLWDVSTGQGFTQYTEHQKRAWSVDFSRVDPTKLASGSDDFSVKLWSIKERNCIDTIRNVANVCCVQFSSHSSHLLAFGSADYKVYCYDLRNTRIPWCTLAGHGKAVSYVKFVDSETVVSASTDNTLKLWDLKKTSASGLSTNASSLTLSGHTNEKNFVGLSVSDGYIACGSETNEVYTYYRTLPMPVTSHKFGSIDPITGQESGDDNGQFVSSVCWRSKSNMVVAANSSGSIKLLRLV